MAGLIQSTSYCHKINFNIILPASLQVFQLEFWKYLSVSAIYISLNFPQGPGLANRSDSQRRIPMVTERSL
jgi:hypothetical protein